MIKNKGKYKQALAIGIISLISITGIHVDNTYAEENNNIVNETPEIQINLGDLISDIKIENKDEILMYNPAEISLVAKDKNIAKVIIDGNGLYYSEETKRFEGNIVFQKSDKEYTYKGQSISIYFENGEKLEFLREYNEDIFGQIDFRVTLATTIEGIYIDKKDNIKVGDSVKVGIKFKGGNIGTEALNSTYITGSSGYWPKFYYKRKNKTYESVIHVTDEHIGNNKLIQISKLSYNDEHLLDVGLISKEILKQGDFYVNRYIPIKSIKIVNKEDIDNNSQMKFRAEMTDETDVDYISVKYEAGPYDYNKMEYKLYKKDLNIFEGTGNIPHDRKNYVFKSVEVHKVDGSIVVYEGELPFGADLHIDGTAQEGHWVDQNDKFYYFDENGNMVTGWLKDKNSKWYYLKSDGVMATGWEKINETWYYLKSSGSMATGWENINGTWYYLKGSGAMATGWEKVNGTWYYLRGSGSMAVGWEKINGTWYYLKSSGAMATGWLDLSGKWYYLKDSGAMAIGWQKVSGKWYYLYGSGIMAKNTKVDGWRINSSGVATKIK